MDEVLISIKNLEKTYGEKNDFLALKKEAQLVLKDVNLDKYGIVDFFGLS